MTSRLWFQVMLSLFVCYLSYIDANCAQETVVRIWEVFYIDICLRMACRYRPGQKKRKNANVIKSANVQRFHQSQHHVLRRPSTRCGKFQQTGATILKKSIRLRHKQIQSTQRVCSTVVLAGSDDEIDIGPDGYSISRDAWKRFTPQVIDSTRCQSRVWKNGEGGQCKNRISLTGCNLCTNHRTQHDSLHGLTHGYVTCPIPPTKLLEFMRCEMRNKNTDIFC